MDRNISGEQAARAKSLRQELSKEWEVMAGKPSKKPRGAGKGFLGK